MKKQNSFIIAILLSLALFACVRDWINPYDSDCPADIWSPKDLAAKEGKPGVMLNWEQLEKHFDGFTLERSTDSSNWILISSQLITSSAREYKDTIHQPGQAFYYRILAVADKNKSNYAYSPMFFYPSVKPMVITSDITDVDSVSATFNGVLKDEGGAQVTERGFYFGQKTNVESTGTKISTTDTQADFSVVVDTLHPGKMYFVKAYAINEIGTGYGVEKSFVTNAALSKVLLDSVSVASASQIHLFGNVTDDGNAEDGVTERGFYIDEGKVIPGTTAPFKVQAGNGSGTFNEVLSNLQPGATYTAIAYSVNIAGASFSDTISFKMPAVLATVTLNDVTKVLQYSAIASGEVTDDGGAIVTDRGFCWYTDENPTKVFKPSGNGFGEFDEDLKELMPNTRHFIKAYAVNEVDTAFSSEFLFTTLPDTAVVQTLTPGDVNSTSALWLGNLLDDGGSMIREIGFCYLSELDINLDEVEAPVPNFSNSYVKALENGDSFIKQMNGLQSGIEYFIRSYAINEADTSFGNTISFITLCNDCEFDGTFTDPDGNVYNTKQYGDQLWMTQNLAYLPTHVNQFNDSSRVAPKYYVYNYNGTVVAEARKNENYTKYGVLYNWVAANQLTALIGNGWRLPTDEDWKKFEAAIGMPVEDIELIGFRGTTEGTRLKYCRDYFEPYETGTDEFCFSAKASGIRGTIDWGGVDLPFGIGVGTAWWSSTINHAQSGDFGYLRAVTSASPKIFRIDGELDFGFPVRLVRDID